MIKNDHKNTTEISKVPQKPILISVKMLFLESPHSMGLLKGSQMLQQNCELIK